MGMLGDRTLPHVAGGYSNKIEDKKYECSDCKRRRNDVALFDGKVGTNARV